MTTENIGVKYPQQVPVLESQSLTIPDGLAEDLDALVSDGGLDVILAVDCSGSTVGHRPSLVHFCERSEQLLDAHGAGLTVFGFDDCLYPLKDRGEPGQFEHLLRIGAGGTPTQHAVAQARLEADKSGAKHRLILVHTDGATANPDALHGQIAGALQDGHLFGCIGWGVGYDSNPVSKQYGDTYVNGEVEGEFAALAQILSRQIVGPEVVALPAVLPPTAAIIDPRR